MMAGSRAYTRLAKCLAAAAPRQDIELEGLDDELSIWNIIIQFSQDCLNMLTNNSYGSVCLGNNTRVGYPQSLSDSTVGFT